MDIFDNKGIKPMLIGEMRDAFDSPDYIYEIKLDGIRCLTYLDGNEADIRNKRDKKLLPHFPELSHIHKHAAKKCILDGEVFVLKNGVIDFYETQRRALMTDPFKIRIAADLYPASFVAYDIIYYNNKPVNELSLMERKDLLDSVVNESERISVSRYIEEKGIDLFQLVKEKALEGIVAKKKDSKYWFDKRTRDWIKCKIMQTEDCVVCGYIQKENNMTSLVLGQYDKGVLVYRGHVTLGASLRNLYQHDIKVTDISPFGYVPQNNHDVVWIEPSLVCIVESMPTDKDSWRQPVLKGFRDDKSPEECENHTILTSRDSIL